MPDDPTAPELIVIRWADPPPGTVISPSNIGTFLPQDSQGTTIPTDLRVTGYLSAPVSWGLNVRDYGAVLDGVTDDFAAFQGAYTAAKNWQSITVPAGGVNVTGPTLVRGSGGGTNANLWKLDGNSFNIGAIPVTILGDGDVTETFDGRVSFRKQITTSTNGYAVVEITNINANPSFPAGDVTSSLIVNATASAGCGGHTWPLNVTLTTRSAGNEEVSIASTVIRSGAGATWQYFGQTIDETGVAPNASSANVAFEMDITANGPEASSTGYAPYNGGRAFITFVPAAYNPPSWTGTQAYVATAGAVSVVQPTTPNGYTYICIVAGTSGGSEPTWPIIVGNTVTDGTVTWQCGTTTAMQISRVLSIGGGTGVQIGAPVLIDRVAIYDAGIEMSSSTLVDGGVLDAAIRIAANMPIDWSGDGTAANQNVRTTRYNSTSTALEYKKSGTVWWAIKDNGDAITGKQAAGATTDTGGHLLIPFCSGTPTGAPANAALGIALRYDTAAHKLWAYDNGTSTWKGVALT